MYKDKEIWMNKKYLLQNKNMQELLCIYAVNNINKGKVYCSWSDLI